MRILIAYGTVHGQTRKVVDFLADRFRRQSNAVEVCDTSQSDADPADFDAVVVASAMQMGAYRPSVVRFVQQHRDALTGRHNAFVSVSMAASNGKRELAELDRWIAAFCRKTGWQPAHIEHVAGALAYTKYNFLTRWVMKSIARKQGNATDTTRDHEYTDWDALGAFADRFAASAATAAAPTAA